MAAVAEWKEQLEFTHNKIWNNLRVGRERSNALWNRIKWVSKIWKNNFRGIPVKFRLKPKSHTDTTESAYNSTCISKWIWIDMSKPLGILTLYTNLVGSVWFGSNFMAVTSFFNPADARDSLSLPLGNQYFGIITRGEQQSQHWQQ